MPALRRRDEGPRLIVDFATAKAIRRSLELPAQEPEPLAHAHRQPCRGRCAAISGAIAMLLGKPNSYSASGPAQVPSCRRSGVSGFGLLLGEVGLFRKLDFALKKLIRFPNHS